jgi:hypothetical protein
MRCFAPESTLEKRRYAAAMLSGPIEVQVWPGSSFHDVEAVFGAVGLEVDVRDDELISIAPPVEVTIVVAPLVWLALAFAGGAASKAGEDAWDAYRSAGWRGLRRLVQELYGIRHPGAPSYSNVVRVDVPRDLSVRIPVAIPEQGLRALAELDWEAMEGGILEWNVEAATWVHVRWGHSGSIPHRSQAPRRQDR